MTFNRRVGGLVGDFADDHARCRLGAEAVLETLEIVAARIVVLVEDSDFALGQVLQNVLCVDPALGLVGGLPTHRPREVLWIAEFGGAGGDEELRHLLVIQVFLNGVVGWRAEALEDKQHFIAFHELTRLFHGLRRAEAVVIGNEVDLSPVDTALGVELPEKGVLGPPDQRVG